MTDLIATGAERVLARLSPDDLVEQVRAIARWDGLTARTRWMDGTPGDARCVPRMRLGEYLACNCKSLGDCLGRRAAYRLARKSSGGLYTWNCIDLVDVEIETREVLRQAPQR